MTQKKTAQITKKTPLDEVMKHVRACSCKACTHGCRFGSGLFVEGQIEKLATFLKKDVSYVKKHVLEEVEHFNTTLFRPKIVRKKGKPYGTCSFFDEKKGCTIHEVKPLQCTLAMGCTDSGQDLMVWFMLNYQVNAQDARSMQEYSSYVKSGGHVIAGGEVESLVPDKESRKKLLDGHKPSAHKHLEKTS